MKVKVLQNILDANTQMAQKNQRLLDNHRSLALNIMSSPGAGKTSLILKTIARLKDKTRIAVIEGDIASTIDADLISDQGVAVVQINTGGGCHLDANMVENALNNLKLNEIDLLFIENVGNLVCPASFDLGEHRRVVVSSTPEGDDKPVKYPVAFRSADCVVLNKIDLVEATDFSPASFSGFVRDVKPGVPLLELSCKTGEGLGAWLVGLRTERAGVRGRAAPSPE